MFWSDILIVGPDATFEYDIQNVCSKVTFKSDVQKVHPKFMSQIKVQKKLLKVTWTPHLGVPLKDLFVLV